MEQTKRNFQGDYDQVSRTCENSTVQCSARSLHFGRISILRRVPTVPSRTRVVFAESTTVIYLDDNEYHRRARVGTWIMKRRIFEHCVRRLELLLGHVLRKQRFAYRISCLEDKLGPILCKHLTRRYSFCEIV